MQNIYKILFVCSGNTCRSPIAEGYFNSKIRELTIDGVTSSSAGLMGFGNQQATEKAIQVMQEIGVDINNHKSKMLTIEMLDEFDLILTMSKQHKNLILSNTPEYKGKVFILHEFVESNLSNEDISDPIGQNIQFYREIREIICKLIDKLIEEIKTKKFIK